MPKMKTHSGAKKRFKVTGTGKVRGRHPFTSHILEKKSPKKKRMLGAPKLINAHDEPRIKRMLGAPTGTRKASGRAGSSGRSSTARTPARGGS
jgi:large subunit ribosomal protein L35